MVLFLKRRFPPFPARWRVSRDSILVLVFAATRNGAETSLVQFEGEKWRNYRNIGLIWEK